MTFWSMLTTLDLYYLRVNVISVLCTDHMVLDATAYLEISTFFAELFTPNI